MQRGNRRITLPARSRLHGSGNPGNEKKVEENDRQEQASRRQALYQQEFWIFSV